MERTLDERAYVLWYHKIFGSTKRGRTALDFYGGDYFRLYDAIYNKADKSGVSQKMKPSVFEEFSPVDAMGIIRECEENYGWRVITCRCPEYPEALLEIENYPHVLFCDGDVSVLKRSLNVAVVGSREAKHEAEVFARNASFNLAKTGAVIVSGAALGIDSCAHLGAVEAGGETIAVLGCGLGSDYLKRIGDFYDRMKAHGVYITEMFPFANASRYSFPERNRIISGLSRAVLVTCAAEGSGSLITADLARKQGRRVYAVAPELCFSTGCKKILSEYAYPFYTAGDIAYPLKDFYPEGRFSDMYCSKPVISNPEAYTEEMAIPKKKTSAAKASSYEKTPSPVKPSPVKKPSPAKKSSPVNEALPEEKPSEAVLPDYLTEEAKAIYALLGDEPVAINGLVYTTGFRINIILAAVTELNLEKLISVLPGSRIQKKK